MTRLERFSEETGIPTRQAAKLVAMGRRAGRYNERYCNGDKHPSVDTGDKAENSTAWQEEVRSIAERMSKLSGPYAVVFTGLFPSLKNCKTGQYFDLPY